MRGPVRHRRYTRALAVLRHLLLLLQMLKKVCRCRGGVILLALLLLLLLRQLLRGLRVWHCRGWLAPHVDAGRLGHAWEPSHGSRVGGPRCGGAGGGAAVLGHGGRGYQVPAVPGGGCVDGGHARCSHEATR